MASPYAKTGPIVPPHHSEEDPVRQAHEKVMHDTADTLKDAILSLSEISKQVQGNNVTTARVAGSVEAMSARVDGLASRIGNVDQRMTAVSTTVETLREDIHDDLKDIKESQRSDRVEINGIRSVLNEYVSECREYRAIRLKDDIAGDKARGIRIDRHTPTGELANGENRRGILSSTTYALKQPWFWVILLGFMFGFGGVDLASSIAHRILDATFGDEHHTPVLEKIVFPTPTPTPRPSMLDDWAVKD